MHGGERNSVPVRGILVLTHDLLAVLPTRSPPNTNPRFGRCDAALLLSRTPSGVAQLVRGTAFVPTGRPAGSYSAAAAPYRRSATTRCVAQVIPRWRSVLKASRPRCGV